MNICTSSDIVVKQWHLYHNGHQDLVLVLFLDIVSTVTSSTRKAVIQIIYNNWNSFCVVRGAWKILDFEFCSDTGDTKAVCCHKRTYGVHESKVAIEHIS